MRALHAIHDFLPRHRAGSELYALGLARALEGRGHEVHVVCAEYDPSRPHASLAWREVDGLPVTEIVNNWRVERLEDAWESPRIGDRLETVLDVVRPDVLHVHNLLNLSLALPGLARRRGIPVVATLHDFTLFCVSGGQRLHRAEDHLCEEVDPVRCARCFPQSPFHQQMTFARLGDRSTGMVRAGRIGSWVRRRWPRVFERLGTAASRSVLATVVTPGDIERRLARAREIGREIDLFVAPSATLAADHERFGLSGDRILVSDYGFPDLGAKVEPIPDGRETLRIGFVGTLAWHKGAHVLLGALRRLADVDRWRLEIHGSLDTFPDYVADLREAARGLPVRFRGGFDREDLPGVYGSFDVLVVPSLWPENSPLVIHEAFQAGRPVIGARRGGIPELLGRGGWLFDPSEEEELVRILRRLVADPGLVAARARRLPAVKTLGEDAAEWESRYAEVRAAGRSPDP